MKSPYTGITRILKAFTYSKDGFIAAFQSEAAFRQDLLFCLITAPIALFCEFSLTQKALLLSSLLLMLLMELANSAVEAAIDRISPDYHELSKKAKDIGSLLVLISYLNIAIIWGFLFYEKYM